MRELTRFESEFVAGGSDVCERDICNRDGLCELTMFTSLLVAPLIGAHLGMSMVAGMGINYTLGGLALGTYAGIVTAPIAALFGLKVAYAVIDTVPTN
ncbi:hypothetical protein [Candidatus Berkiella aquae]|uniref:Uncharacterized protein n=1 Tax=Candidatus Berkiella aquae TaxID=295108 RepID=A0A0Q9YUU2_9GAMM|nr:hypothetical protein [Candidatus Berkiella aquae]MCS5710703.1 hypothetical protein [Candidatus Berkiella aquae]